MKIISVLDTTISDYNLGNQIIMESVNEIIDCLFERDFLFRLQYAEKFGRQSIKYMESSDYVFFGGTNSLSSEMNRYKQWGFSLKDLYFVSNLILLGVGWWQYQSKPNLYTQFFLKRLLSSNKLHSVRDSYTEKMLKNIGIRNVLNTSCPTLWEISPEHCRAIPKMKSKDVVFTTTDYSQDYFLDNKLIKLLLLNYEYVYYWVQGIGDLEYLSELDLADRSRVKIIPPKLKAYDRVLEDLEVDYIGTRLHAGIRAIQKQKRTLVLATDNRAKEISKDVGLNVVGRDDFSGIEGFINNEHVTNLFIPTESIQMWKEQFRNE